MGYQPIPPHDPLSVDFGEADLPACDLPFRYVLPVVTAGPPASFALFRAGGVDLPTYVRFAFLPATTVALLLFGGVVWSLRRRGARLVDVGLTVEEWPREVAVGVVVGLALLVFFPAVSWVVDSSLPSTPVLEEARPDWIAGAYAFAVVAVLAPVGEVVWRGFAIATLRHRIGLAAAVVVSSAAFGLNHWWGGPALVVTTAVFGLVLALVYVWRGRLLAPIVCHAIAFPPLVLLWPAGL